MQSTCSWGFYHKSTEKYLLLGFLRKTPRAENYGFFEFSKFRFFEKNPLFFQNFAMGSRVPIFTMYTEPGKKSNLKSELSSSLGSSPNRVRFRRLVRYFFIKRIYVYICLRDILEQNFLLLIYKEID